MPSLSIVVPAYNEEEHIEGVCRSLAEAAPRIRDELRIDSVEILVVNDGSIDSTGSLLDRLAGSLNGQVRVFHHAENLGYGAALKTGFKSASGDYLSFMDADGTLKPESFIEMYRVLQRENADVVVGTRFGSNGSQMPWIRRMGNRFFALLLSLLSGQKVKDSASGIRLFRKEIVPLLLALPDGLHFTPAMSTKVLHEKLKIAEVPVPYAERSGKSKLNIVQDGVRFLKIIVGTVLMYNPFKVFFLMGLTCEIVAVSLLFAPLYALVSKEDVLFSDYIYRSIGGLYFFIAGTQLTLFGIVARFLVSTFFKSHESGTLVHMVNRYLKVYHRMSWYGFGVMTLGLWINGVYFGGYMFGGGIELHWAWLLLGAGFIIVGLEMIISGVLMRIIRDIQIAKDIL